MVGEGTEVLVVWIGGMCCGGSFDKLFCGGIGGEGGGEGVEVDMFVC